MNQVNVSESFDNAIVKGQSQLIAMGSASPSLDLAL